MHNLARSISRLLKGTALTEKGLSLILRFSTELQANEEATPLTFTPLLHARSNCAVPRGVANAEGFVRACEGSAHVAFLRKRVGTRKSAQEAHQSKSGYLAEYLSETA